MTYDIAAHLSVVWTAESRQAIRTEAGSSMPSETGGILLGNWQQDKILITHMIGPGPKAEHYPDSFTPDRDWQYEQIDLLFAETLGTIQYLGDWHTHPLGIPSPSKTDRLLLKAIATSPESKCPRPIMCILAPTPNNVWAERLFLYDAEPSHGSFSLHRPRKKLYELVSAIG